MTSNKAALTLSFITFFIGVVIGILSTGTYSPLLSALYLMVVNILPLSMLISLLFILACMLYPNIMLPSLYPGPLVDDVTSDDSTKDE
jgi:hypothetical protein